MADDQEKIEEQTIDEETEDVSETTEAKPKKNKKVVRRRKTKKERENPLTVAIRLTVESGKVEFGARRGVASSLNAKAKLFVVAGNTPEEIKKNVHNYAEISEVPVIDFPGSSMELGSVCGRPFPITVLSVYDAGTSNILELAK
ncbi:MAG: 50S ribosomal protein L30e [Candidatus Micrarchaeota archaeon]|nr:50S ribosomal protein L30e [Candidatus Micrarchaeota archaeon]MBU1681932.1 50S ribosomal protein L30e [Candidatus Micrarchaeota archaeon]